MLENGFWVGNVQVVLCHIDHSIGKTPFVVKPDQEVQHPITAETNLLAINDGRVNAVIEIDERVAQ